MNIYELGNYVSMVCDGDVDTVDSEIESEFSRSVFSESSRTTHKLEIDLSGLLRGDPAQRWASWKIAADAKILTVNEIREMEGFNPLPAPSA